MGDLPDPKLEHFEQGSRKLASLGSMFVSLAGGEPLLRDDLPEIVRLLARFHLPFVTTNGYLASPRLARELFGAGLWGVSVSLDYADAQRHDRRRGKKGAFDRAVRALETFSAAPRKAWQRVNLMCVLMEDNLDQIEPLIQLAAEHRAFFMVQLYSELKTGSTRFLHHRGAISERLLELKDRYPNFLSNRVFLSRFDRALAEGVPGCHAGRAFFNIDSTGDVAICVEQRHRPVGNLYRDHPQRIIHALRGRSAGNTCQACWYNCRGETEMLYHPTSLLHSLPTYIWDTAHPPATCKSSARGLL